MRVTAYIKENKHMKSYQTYQRSYSPMLTKEKGSVTEKEKYYFSKTKLLNQFYYNVNIPCYRYHLNSVKTELSKQNYSTKIKKYISYKLNYQPLNKISNKSSFSYRITSNQKTTRNKWIRVFITVLNFIRTKINPPFNT